jgi:membrane protease YdiL (CAAX protease family)
MLTVFTLYSFASYLVLALLPRVSGISFEALVHITPVSSLKTIRVGLIAVALLHVGTFAIPALLFASFTHPRIKEYLGIRAPGRRIHWLIVTGIMLGLIPVLIWGETWMTQHLHFGKWADEKQQENDNIFKAFLKLNTGPDLGLLLAVLALLPAIGEELIFRGVLLRLLHRRISRALPSVMIDHTAIMPDTQRSMVFPVICTALIFAFWHSSPYGFVFIFIAGCILALIYFHTGSLLCSMWAHFLFNGTQLAAVFLTHHSEAAQQIAGDDNLPVIYPIAGLVIFVGCFYALVRRQTPLPADWSADFKPGEE